MEENAKVFLRKVKDKIKNGSYDHFLTVPFLSRDLIYISIKNRILKKIETKATPLLSEMEIESCINDAKKTAAEIYLIFRKTGILKQTDEGLVVPKEYKKYLNHFKNSGI